jgi:hypothetical protein
MRFSRATVITTGAVASLAVMGAAPAMAAESAIAKSATVFGQVQGAGNHAAAEQSPATSWYGAMNEGGAPWQATPTPLVGVLNGSNVSAAPWQICGSTVVAGVGGSVPLFSPNTVVGDCNNNNTVLINH